MTEAQIEYVATHNERDRCVAIVTQFAADLAPNLDEASGERAAFVELFASLVALLNAEPS